MHKHFPFLALLVATSVGCDSAAKQQQAEQAQNAAVANDLREKGEAMHNPTEGGGEQNDVVGKDSP